MSLGIGKRRLIDEIITKNWEVKSANEKQFNYNELLFVIQEMLDEEGKKYFEKRVSRAGHTVFRYFVKHLLYRNIANYDSMVLMTSEKGCITGDALLEMPRDLKKYPKGIPLKELVGKGPIYVYSFNIKTKKLELKKCDGVEFVKNDDVYELELTNGMKIKATGDHPFLQINGKYKQLKDLFWHEHTIRSGPNKGKKLYGKKGTKFTDRLRIFSRPHILDINDNRIKVDFSNIDRNGDTSLKHSDIEHRFIMKQLGYNIDNKIIHHINEKTYDNNLSNLKILENQSKHYNEHNMEQYQFQKNNKYGKLGVGYSTKKKNKIKKGTEEYIIQCQERRINFCINNKEKISTISKNREKNNINSNHIKNGGVIKSIKYLGKQDVYDVVNVQDNHNFIVNGFVVSNTGKSSAAIMIAREWCKLIGIKFNPARHIAYNNADVMRKVDQLNKFEPIICDEAIRFASAAEWAKSDNKELKKKLAEVRTKHLLYILCFPLKIYKLEKTYLESYTNYWIDLFGRGLGAIYVKDKNPVQDSWRMKEFQKIGSYTEFTTLSKVEKQLKKHPNFWQIIKFPKPPEWLYTRYLKVREANVYDDENVMANVGKQDIHNALLILALRDIITQDANINMGRIILHIKNQYDINLSKGMVQAAIEDARQLVTKIREQATKV